ncbi:hypothetical protein D9613_002370 [Agrocybe pediades]|uniref:Uncharacterized protein n=1 Tax=Agrocybe pediades TaxID=84607 RepID=A0A8H4R7B3_9AGAR|nr:hypothetical protein D9613_002370 [Agrocybe pediades]
MSSTVESAIARAPAVLSATLDLLQELAKKLTLANGVRVLPKIGKTLVCLLFLANIKSWPLVWHFRIFRPVFRIRLEHLWIRIQMFFMSPLKAVKLEDRWLDSITPVGANPFSVVIPYRTQVALDDSDFNGHLSNSSYAKIMDGARFKAAIELFPMFFRAGGWIALAGTHYHFIKEIPMLTSYEIRTSIVAWDRKWVYIMSRFVRKPDGKKKKRDQKLASPNGEISTSIRAPGSEEISTNGTPYVNVTPNGTTETVPDLKAVAANLAGEEPDGAVLHTIVVSQICYKIGRITVPPALMLAVNGFTGTPNCSLASPHPEWATAKKVMSKPRGGNPKKLKALLTGGWRDVPENERWWETALGPELEAQNLKNLEQIEHLRKGLELARGL